MRDYSEEVVMNKNDTAVFGGITLKWLGETKFDIICDGVTVMANAISEDPVPGQAFEVLIRIDIIGPDQAKIAAQVRTCRIEQGMSGQVYEIDMTAWEEEDNASRKIRGTSYSLGFYGTAPDKMSMKVFCNEDFPIWRSNISEGNTKNIEVKQCDAKLEVKISNLTLEEEGGRVHVSGTAIVTGPELQ
jgi:hypothetical protein